MHDEIDETYLDEIHEHSFNLLKVLDRLYKQDSQFILTILATSFCTLGVGMHGKQRFKRLLDQMHLQVDEMFENSNGLDDTIL